MHIPNLCIYVVAFHSQKHNVQHQKRSFAKISWCKINIQRFKFSVIQVMYIVERFTFGSWFWNQKNKKKKIWETINWDKVFKNGPSTVFQKWYLIHSWVPCPNCFCVLWQWNNKMNKISIYVVHETDLILICIIRGIISLKANLLGCQIDIIIASCFQGYAFTRFIVMSGCFLLTSATCNTDVI